jgi:signal transduction histidine kinase
VSLGDYRLYRSQIVSTVAIFFLMYVNRLFIGPLPKIGLNLLIWGSYASILLIPKSWWTRERFILAAFVISIESVAALIWYQETNMIYFLAILIISSVTRLSLAKSPISAMVVVFVMAMLYTRHGNSLDLFHFISFVLSSVVIYLILWSRRQRNEMYELDKRRLVELQEAYDQLQETSVTAMQYAVLEERTRIAREIHDALGHSLTSLIVQIQALGYMIKKDPLQAEQSLVGMLSVARQGLQDIRTSVHALDDDRLGSGIPPLKALLSRMEESASIRYTFHHDLNTEDVSMEVYGTLFRVLQGAITNVIRHSQATLVDVSLKSEAGKFVLHIRDNGVLKTSQKICEGFGLKAMKARIEEKGGLFHYAILEPHGFEIIAEIPTGAHHVPYQNEKDE